MAIKKNISETKAQLSSLLEKVQKGEVVIIGKSGKPIAKIVAFTRSDRTRSPNTLKGKITIGDDFEALDEEVTKLFEGD